MFVLGNTGAAGDVVVVALIAGPITAAVGALLQRRSTGKQVGELHDKIGEPNGHGSLVGMVQEVLTGQARQDERLARLEDRLGTVEGRVSALEQHRADRVA